DCFGKRLRGLLRQVVTDAALDRPVLIFAGELLGVSARGRVRRTVGVALHGDGRHADGGRGRETLFQLVVFSFALGQALPPAVIVDHDVDVIRIVEGCRGTVERGVVEF